MLVSLIGTMSVVMAVAGYFSYRAGLQEAGEMFDAKLAHSARVLVSLVDQPLDELVAHGPAEPLTINVWHGVAKGVGDDLVFPTGHAYETKLAFQVRDTSGRLLLRSDSGPDHALAPLQAGYRNVTIDGQNWRSFTLMAPSGYWYQAGELSDIRSELAQDIAFGTLLPLLIALPVMALLVWFLVTWALRNVVNLSRQIEQREADNLAALDLQAVPKELLGVARAVNGLMQRLDSAMKRERRFTADVAHELRTPISALKVHADNVCEARDGAEREEAQRLMQRSVTRLNHLVSQMLSLSRVDEGAGLRANVPVDMDSLVSHQVIEHRSIAAKRGITIELHSVPLQVAGDPIALDSLVRNVLDNAVRYTPEHGKVIVTVSPHESNARLEVEDSGPGIPPEARQRVFNRFHRELGTGVEGNGLGLAIVRSVLMLHRGRVELDASPGLGGLRVIAEIPLR
ncbi:ATP-binding protein [Lysobacter sp. S4-A87]|uniref:ATP-binding protein n=1 Tax=Lysobacter sp. S4-A87 TaxID=2925843 RepID=UPI001F5359F4|nr:ATP-binding protein [Lysobacter sp. S4-A87]UNK49812.1 ATP-binding protein [Lysobacter sp. S4-A87]